MRAPEFWREDGAIPALLSPLGAVYRAAAQVRVALTRPYDPGVPVICVGNLVAGGAGKTPVALSLLSLLTARGLKAQALGRGYGGRLAGPLRVDPAQHGAADVGDEALLLARAAPTWIARDRAAGARAAAGAGAQAGAQAGAEVIVMDDGFQNPCVVKRLSLLVVDGAYGFGNGRIMPAGPLREPAEAGLARADAVIILGGDTWGVAARVGGRRPLLHAHLEPCVGAPDLKGQRVLAFAGIGRPEKFFATLEGLGAEVAARHAFADHHLYSGAEIAHLIAEAETARARAVTTEKDAVRLPPEFKDKVSTVPVRLVWRDPRAIETLLSGALKRNEGAAIGHGAA